MKPKCLCKSAGSLNGCGPEYKTTLRKEKDVHHWYTVTIQNSSWHLAFQFTMFIWNGAFLRFKYFTACYSPLKVIKTLTPVVISTRQIWVILLALD